MGSSYDEYMDDYEASRTKPKTEAEGQYVHHPDLTPDLMENIWRSGFDAENSGAIDYCDDLIIARNAIEESDPAPAKVPEGYALVPIEPTDKALHAMQNAIEFYCEEKGLPISELRKVYRAMLKSQGGE